MPRNSPETPVWDNFSAVARLLNIRRDGQLIPNYLEEVEQQESELPSSYSKFLSNNADAQSWLKDYFCDRFAELVSNKNSGNDVTSLTVHYQKKRVRIVVARNMGFTEEHKDFLKKFAIKWHECAKSTTGDTRLVEITAACWTELWIMMVNFHHRRNWDYFKISDILEASPFTQTTSARNETKKMVSLQYLINPLNEQQGDKAQLISAAYYLQHDQEFLAHLKSALEKSRYEEIKRDIQVMAQLRTIYTTFVAVIFRLANFSSLVIDYVPEPEKASRRSLEFSKAIQIATIERYSVSNQLQPNLTPEAIAQQYEGLPTCGYVHAEVQLILHHLQKGTLKSITYMGCSKLNCFMCSRLLAHFKVKSAGCHHKHYGGWDIPRISGKSYGKKKFREALGCMQTEMIGELNQPYTDPESTPRQPCRQHHAVSLRSPTNNSPGISDMERFAYEVPDTWMSQYG